MLLICRRYISRAKINVPYAFVFFRFTYRVFISITIRRFCLISVLAFSTITGIVQRDRVHSIVEDFAVFRINTNPLQSVFEFYHPYCSVRDFCPSQLFSLTFAVNLSSSSLASLTVSSESIASRHRWNLSTVLLFTTSSGTLTNLSLTKWPRTFDGPFGRSLSSSTIDF